MNDPKLLDTLASYVPTLITRHLADDPLPPAGPTTEPFSAAVLYADISGFTALTERLARRGPTGTEELSQLLNTYFGQLIDLITAHGGDIVKFAGDALIALWPVVAGDTHAPARGRPVMSLPEAALRAAQCGLVVQKQLNGYEVAEGVFLSLKLIISAGEVLVARLGGIYGRWEFLVAGQPVTEVAIVDELAQPGDVLLTPAVWTLIEARCVGVPVYFSRPAGELQKSIRLSSVSISLRPQPALLPTLRPAAEVALRAYIPGAIMYRLAAGQTGWLAELRRVTILFINLPDLNYATPLPQAQAVMCTLQADLYHYEGSINKLNVDDKGVTLVAALGLPPLAHEDDAVRGVQAALAMQATLRALGLRGAIGVTTGRAFCGSIGNTTRREYTMIGDVVNLAARLMQAAGRDAIFCDEATHQAAYIHIAFEALPAVTAKGKVEPIPVYRPLGPKKITGQMKSALVGRLAERATLAEHIQTLLRGTNGLVLLEGEAGIGKSRLAEDLLRQAQAMSVTTLVGAGDAVEKATPYHAWRPIFSQLFHLDAPTDDSGTIARAATALTDAQRSRILAQVETFTPELMHLVPLLNAILPLDLTENDLTAQMTGEVRADNTHQILVGLLRGAAGVAPLLLILEDAHWLDSASWTLARRVSQAVQPALLLIVTRPLSDPIPAEYTTLLNTPHTRHLRLDALPAADIETLLCQRLGVAGLPQPVLDFIQQKAEGHPFFSEEMAYALREAGLIHIINGECRLDPGAGDLQTLNFPDTIQGVITSRIDRLSAQEQLTLKVASVIGRVFPFHILRHIHPIEADKANLPDYLNSLERMDITLLETPAPDLTYTFKHIITQEVAYNLMAYAQRWQLHRAVATWYEQAYHHDLTPFFPLLAHHWHRAGDPAKAIDYLEKAGEQALRNFANQEAIHFLTEAIALGEKQAGKEKRGGSMAAAAGGPPPARLRCARWQRQLGEAHLGLGNLAESQAHLQQALALLGWGMPTTRGQLALSLVGQLLQQVWHRLYGPREPGAPFEQEAMLEAAYAYEPLGETFYFANEGIPTIYCALRILNLSERTRAAPILARAYAGSSAVAGVIPAHAVAEMYQGLALKLLPAVTRLPAVARVLLLLSTYDIGVCRWELMQDRLAQAIEICQRIGDKRQLGDGQAILGLGLFYQSQFSASRAVYDRLCDTTTRSGDDQLRAWALIGQGKNALRLGHLDAALAFLAEGMALAAASADRRAEITSYGATATARLRQGEYDLARQAADTVMRFIASSTRPTSRFLLEGYAGPAEVYLALWAQGTDNTVADLKKAAQQACRALQRYARIFPFAQPRAWLWQGLYEWQAGRASKAIKTWQKSLAAAENLNMPYDQALAHARLGRHASEAARPAHLAQARDIFARLEATYDLDQLQATLKEPVL